MDLLERTVQPEKGARLRVLFVNSFYAPEIEGGAEVVLHALASGLHGRGHTVAAFTTGDSETIDEVDGVIVYRFPIDNAFRKLSDDLRSKPRRILWQWRDRSSALMAERMDRVIRVFRPDAIQFQNLSGITRSVWKVPQAHGISSAQILHDLNLICPRSSMFKRGKSCLRQCAPCALFRRGFAAWSKQVDVLVGVSRFVMERIVGARYFPHAEHRVIYNALKLSGPSPLTGDPDVRFGFIGALSPHKGVAWLIDQFDDSMGSLTIAGKGDIDYVDALKRRAIGKRIQFVGYVPSSEFFPTIDVAVVPSMWNDTLPGAAIEGSAYGRPVIASRLGGLPEIVRDGETGLLVDPDRPDTLGAAMRLLADERALLMRMAEAGPAAVAKLIDFERFLDEHEALCGYLAAGAKNHR